MKAVNVRNVAERAGYSYATIYNYFKDLKELVFYCVKDFQEECEMNIQGKILNSEKGKHKIRSIALAYTEYFIQYPGIFELFYVERNLEIANVRSEEIIVNFLDRLCKDDWQYCLDNHLVTINMMEQMKSKLHTIITGSLLLYLNRQHPAGYKSFIQSHTEMIDSVLGL